MNCDYGCGREARYYFANGKNCCTSRKCYCPEYKKLPENQKYKPLGIEINTNKLCDNGCGQTAKYVFKHGKLCCSAYINSCPINKEKNSKSIKKVWDNLNIIYNTKEHKDKLAETSRSTRTKEVLDKIQKANIKAWKNNPQPKQELSKRMRDWQAVHMNKFVKSPSGPQIKTYNIVKEMFNCAEIEFPFITDGGILYRLDIAIPKYKIAIEYDGSYWHQDQKKDLKRQRECEDYGWKFVRYIDKVPAKEKIREDIMNLLSNTSKE
jgi:hypothetical protein